MKYFAERLKGVRLRMEMKQEKFAEYIGVSTRMLSGYETGDHNPPPAKLRVICEKLRLPQDYFTRDLEPAADPAAASTATPKHHGGPYWGTTDWAPVVSWARAGGEWHSYQDLCTQIDEKLPTDCNDANCFWVKIEGDSMEPKYQPGDYVICMPNVEPQNGDLVIAKMLDGAVYFKHFHRIGDGNRIRLSSYNRDLYPPMEFPLDKFLKVIPVYGAFRRIKGGGKRNH